MSSGHWETDGHIKVEGASGNYEVRISDDGRWELLARDHFEHPIKVMARRNPFDHSLKGAREDLQLEVNLRGWTWERK